jgi:hypothetical protein
MQDRSTIEHSISQFEMVLLGSSDGLHEEGPVHDDCKLVKLAYNECV